MSVNNDVTLGIKCRIDRDRDGDRARDKTDRNISYTSIGSVQPFGISGAHWKKKSFLGLHIKYTNTHENK